MDPTSAELGPEWTALELIARAPLSDEDHTVLAGLLAGDLLWGELLEQAMRHKLVPLMAAQLADDRLRHLLPWHVRSHLGATLSLNRQRIHILRSAAAEIVTALEAAGIPFAATKGITFESTLYEGDGSRYMNDIDFMVRPADRDQATEVMHGLGYEMGSLEPDSQAIRPHSRREMVVYQLNQDHIPVFTRLTGDLATPSVRVDIANSLTWTNSPFEVPVEEALSQTVRQPIPGLSCLLPAFSPYFQFIFTALHLFREAWIERWLDEGQDVNLVKFTDMLRLWRAYGTTLAGTEFRDTVDRFGIADPLSWVVWHLDQLLGTDVLAATGLRGRTDEEWLTSAYRPGGGLYRWQGGMRQRLWAKDRKALRVDAAVVPTP
jgi:hypothetical protein